MIEPRPEIAATAAAVHGGPQGALERRSPVRIDFSTCVNAWGPAPAVVAAAARASFEQYPDPESIAARRAVADRWRIPLESVAFGAGAAELLFAAFFAYLRPGDRALVPAPGFGEYERGAQLCGASVARCLAYGSDLHTDVERFCAAVLRVAPRVVFVCAPGNPTGERFAPDELGAVADACMQADALLVLDQSYDAFLAEPLGTPVLPGHPAVLTIRSMTKDHSIPGIRAGYAIGPPRVIAAIERARTPWSASTSAQAAAVAALSPPGEAHVAATLPRLRAERDRLRAELAQMGYRTLSTSTHFFLLEVADAHRVAGTLRERYAIAVRDCTSFGLPRHLRVAARRPEENDALLLALAELRDA